MLAAEDALKELTLLLLKGAFKVLMIIAVVDAVEESLPVERALEEPICLPVEGTFEQSTAFPVDKPTYSVGRKEMLYLTTHSTHFIYGYMASDIW